MNPLGLLEEAPAYMIYRLSRLLRQNLKKVLKSEGLDVTSEQYFLLYRLYQKDGVAQSQLADNTLGDYPNITRHIDSLAKKGLVERTADSTDRRKYLIKLTPKGNEQMALAVPIIQAERERVFGNYSEEQLSGFRDFVYATQARLV